MKEEQKRRLALLAAVMLILSTGCANTENLWKNHLRAAVLLWNRLCHLRRRKYRKIRDNPVKNLRKHPLSSPQRRLRPGEQADELAAQAKSSWP